MLNKLDALKYFCTAAETLNFRAAAEQLAVTPPVISRTVAELEDELGEQLFRRSTRTIKLTSFGEQFYLHAKQLLTDSERLFQLGKKQTDDMAGTVRITLPELPNQTAILRDLLTALRPYPELTIDWRVDVSKLNAVEHRIDMGIRIGREPDPNFIIKPITTSGSLLVASPDYLAEFGTPKDLANLAKNFPVSGLFNPHTGRIWDLQADGQSYTPLKVNLITDDHAAELASALAGRTVSQISDLLCAPYLASGELVELFPELPQERWQIYLYRPYLANTPKRVLKVFGILEGILREKLS